MCALHVKSGGDWDASRLFASWGGKPTTAAPQGTYQDGRRETNDSAALFCLVTTAGAWLWEGPVKQTHHRVQPVALLIPSDVHLVPRGGGHRGSAEESKQALATGPLNQCEDVSLFLLTLSSSLPLVDDSSPGTEAMQINTDRKYGFIVYSW